MIMPSLSSPGEVGCGDGGAPEQRSGEGPRLQHHGRAEHPPQGHGAPAVPAPRQDPHGPPPQPLGWPGVEGALE